MAIVAKFISSVRRKHKTGKATEHTYRSALEDLFAALSEDVSVVNEPKRMECGAPDLIVQRNNIPVGHVETKDLAIKLRGMRGANKEQQNRYLAAFPNLIYTNFLTWDFYRKGKLVENAVIADLSDEIQPRSHEYDRLERLLREFVAHQPQAIATPRELAESMAGKANLIKNVLSRVLHEDEELDTELGMQFTSFKENLIQDITKDEFADIYAETVAYGMFTARLQDASLKSFSRKEALDLLPETNPFLRSLFSFIAGPDLDDRIAWIIDELALVFQACNVAELMKGFGKLTGRKDPFLHFYETFLASYNYSRRRARGIWYTPEPVVNFIVRAVDGILQKEFGLADGLADTSKVSIDQDADSADKSRESVAKKQDVHRVQILDPATGTGTFLAEIVKQIAPKVQGIAPGMWSKYIEKDLVPRLHGFELLMASYAMCHMKINMVMAELGYRPTSTPPRLQIFLSNSLEEGEPDNPTLPFTLWLSREAKGANKIKRKVPIMCVIGNPPYAGASSNKGTWATGLVRPYKLEPGGKEKLKEKNPKWLSDDYVKFMALAEHMIAKTKEGIMGFITNHGYLDNPTFRGMRWHLMRTFDKIYVLDLHGSTKKMPVSPEGIRDKNVFDIQQGVAIIIAVRKEASSPDLAKVYRGDLWGSREDKYKNLSKKSLDDLISREIDCLEPNYDFVHRDRRLSGRYNKGFSITEFMPNYSSGIVTGRDKLVIGYTEEDLKHRISEFTDSEKTDEQIRARFFSGRKAGKYPAGDTNTWKLAASRKFLQKSKYGTDVRCIAHRPFDVRSILYKRGMVERGRFGFMRQAFSCSSNMGLATVRQMSTTGKTWSHVFVANSIIGNCLISNKTKENNCFFPLYFRPDLRPDEGEYDQRLDINFDGELWSKLRSLAKDEKHGEPDETATFDYIYGVLHCPAYRRKYVEFLSTRFPRIPWPKTPAEFWDISEKGERLRKLHLMDLATVGDAPYEFTGNGDNVVGKIRCEDGCIWINKKQRFVNVPEASWDFQIGSYRPAQRWLNDRKGRELVWDDIRHYQRMLKILSETSRIMQSIDM